MSFMFTSESVTAGHPDKVCDQISDAIVDRVLRQDPQALVVSESAISSGLVFVAARMQFGGGLDVPSIARDVIEKVGYKDKGFDLQNCAVMTSITQLSLPEAVPGEADAEDEAIDQLAVHDQATVFGYACDHTQALVPLPIWLAHRLARRLTEVHDAGTLPYLSPDGKTQVGIEFEDRKPVRIHSISMVASQLDKKSPRPRQVRADLMEHVIGPALADVEIGPDDRTRYFINPKGPTLGGPQVHSGMTGRKTAVDTYGEFSRYSASALSGKDPTRIDRVGAYAARHAAKNVVAAGLASECELQLSYTIGVAGPVSVQVDTYGTGRIGDEEIAERIRRHFDFRLAGIIRQFDLRMQPQLHGGHFYEKLSTYGQVGRTDMELPWERTDATEVLAS